MNTSKNLKQEYVNQIKAVGQHLIDNADDILFDFETEKIREINIVSNISPCEIPTIEIKKSYYPLKLLERID